MKRDFSSYMSNTNQNSEIFTDSCKRKMSLHLKAFSIHSVQMLRWAPAWNDSSHWCSSSLVLCLNSLHGRPLRSMEQTFGTWSSEGICRALKCRRVGTGTHMKSQRLRYRYSPPEEFYFYKTKMTMNLKITLDSSLLRERLCSCCLDLGNAHSFLLVVTAA